MPLTRIQSSLVSTVANTSITGNIISSQLQPTGITPTRYGNATIIPAFTVGPDGRITALSNVNIGVSAAAQDFITLSSGII